MASPRVDCVIATDPAATKYMATCVMTRNVMGLELVYLGVTSDLGTEPINTIVAHLSEAFAAAQARGCLNPVALVENQRMCSWKQQMAVEKIIHQYWDSINVIHLTTAVRQKDRAIKAVLSTSMNNEKSNQRKKMAYQAAKSWLETYSLEHSDQAHVLYNWEAAKSIRNGKRDMADALMMAIADADILNHVVGEITMSPPLSVLGMPIDLKRGVRKALTELQCLVPSMMPLPTMLPNTPRDEPNPPLKRRKKKHPVIDLTG